MLPVSFVGSKEKSLITHDGPANEASILIQMKRLQSGVRRNRFCGIEDAIAKIVEDVSVKLIGAGGRGYVQLSASGATRLGGGQHRVNAKLLDGIERNRQPNIRLLRLVNDVGGVDSVVSPVVVVAAPAGKSNRTLVTAPGIDCAGYQTP